MTSKNTSITAQFGANLCSPDIVQRLTDVVMMLDAPDAYNREYITAVCRSLLRATQSAPDVVGEKDASHAPVWYSAEAANGWASGYNAALETLSAQAAGAIAWLSTYDGHSAVTTDPDTMRQWRDTLNRPITPLYAGASQSSADSERDAFENWWMFRGKTKPARSTEYDDQYAMANAEMAWRGWQARGAAQGSLDAVHKALFEPDESDAIDNLEGALIDIKRLSEQGKPTDQVCINTIARVMAQLLAVHALCEGSPISSTPSESPVGWGGHLPGKIEP